MPDGSLHWEGVPIAPLAQEKGTPFFLFGEERLLKNTRMVGRSQTLDGWEANPALLEIERELALSSS